MPTMTHAEQTERRKQIAEACKTRTLDEVCGAFGVCYVTALNACQAEGVKYRRRFGHGFRGALRMERAFEVASLLKDRRKTEASIARKMGVTRERVRQIKVMAQKVGLLESVK